jgi:ubiquinone/menaquinone biosynthesis C-methylase UbiE
MDIANTTNTYNQIAKQFSQTRYKIWPGVKKFLNSIPDNAFILDAGCGNGKNMLETNHNFFGIDTSKMLIQIAKEKTKSKTNIIGFDLVSICNMETINNNTYDAIISIAVLHHLSSLIDRITAIKEMIRVCKVGGSILFTVWKLESNEVYDKGLSVVDKLPIDTIDPHDKIILWKDPFNSNKIHKRFYHFFTFKELIELIELIKAVETVPDNKYIKSYKITEEANNYYVNLQLS